MEADTGMVFYDAARRPAAYEVAHWQVLDEGTEDSPRTIFLHKQSELRFTIGCTSPARGEWRFGAKCENPSPITAGRVDALGREVIELWLKAMQTTAEIQVAESEAWEAKELGRIN